MEASKTVFLEGETPHLRVITVISTLFFKQPPNSNPKLIIVHKQF